MQQRKSKLTFNIPSKAEEDRQVKYSNGPQSRKAGETPIKEVATGFSLFFFGLICLSVGMGLMFEYFEGWNSYGDRAWPLVVLGVVTILPGSFVVNIAVGVWSGRKEACWSQIPGCDP